MKKSILFFIPIWFCNIANAQNFTSDITSTIGSNEGGQLNLTNSIKIGKNVKTWTLFNMTGPYGNGLNFWAYAADGTNLGPKMTLSDDGNLNVNSGSIFSRNGSVNASTNSNEGPYLRLINPGKIANGTAADWRIYNMTGPYGNSLQFWAYDTVGCVSGGMCNNRFTLMDNGNVGIGTSTPSNNQGWGRVLDVSGTNHSKILATSNNSNFRVGIFSHNEEWHGGGGFVGTESNHTLFLIAGYDPKMTVLTNGNIGIGTKTPTSKLTVAGNINSREVKVTVDAGADFVFEKDYALPSLQEVEKFVTENKHLPEIASAKEMQNEGINLSEMNIKLLQKIEELTLYVIEQNKRIELLEKKNK